MFLEHQGYPILNNIVFQDNQSAIKMERNGRNSCTGNSRHIAVRYFFTKDRIEKGKLVVEYCPTNLMIADFFTKALQGKVFKFFRDIIMGYTTVEEILRTLKDTDVSFTIKERVENNDTTKNDDNIIEKNSSIEEKLEPSALKEKKNISQSEIRKMKRHKTIRYQENISTKRESDVERYSNTRYI